MQTKPSKFLMNEEGSSPGGGAVTPPPAESPAQSATPAPASGLTLDQVKGLLGEFRTEIKNGIFADLRKAGALKQEKPAEQPAPTSQPTPSAPVAAQAGLTREDLDARLELERVVSTREGKYGLNEAQSKRMRAALSGVSREALAAEADSYLNDMGLAKASTPAASAAPIVAAEAPKPPAAAPSAPTGANLPTSNGLVDLFSIPGPQLRALGSEFVRENLEKLWKVGNSQQGKPERPKPPQR